MPDPWDVIATDAHALVPATMAAVRPRLRMGGELVARGARGRAAWSTRIPSTVRVHETGDAVQVSAGGSAAPHAAPYEHGGTPGTFRHMVFGHRDRWVTQQARPFLGPSFDVTEPTVTTLVTSTLDTVASQLGFH